MLCACARVRADLSYKLQKLRGGVAKEAIRVTVGFATKKTRSSMTRVPIAAHVATCAIDTYRYPPLLSWIILMTTCKRCVHICACLFHNG